MDITEFEKQMPPKAKRSRLEPFLQQIFELKDKGYANWQIQKFLEDNGVKVSQESVRKFIKSREGHTAPPDEKAAAPAPQVGATKASAVKPQPGTPVNVVEDSEKSGVLNLNDVQAALSNDQRDADLKKYEQSKPRLKDRVKQGDQK